MVPAQQWYPEPEFCKEQAGLSKRTRVLLPQGETRVMSRAAEARPHTRSCPPAIPRHPGPGQVLQVLEAPGWSS